MKKPKPKTLPTQEQLGWAVVVSHIEAIRVAAMIYDLDITKGRIQNAIHEMADRIDRDRAEQSRKPRRKP